MNIHFAILEFRLRGSMIVLGFPGGSAGKESACSAGDTGYGGSIPGSEKSTGEGKGNHCSILAWRIARTEDPGKLQSMASQRVDMTEQLTL